MSTQHTRADLPVFSEHLSLRLDEGHPAEVRFNFEMPRKRFGGAVGASILGHGILIAFWAVLLWIVPDRVREAVLPDAFPRQLVWLAEPGPGGGGGGGNQRPEPPKPAEVPGHEKINVPAAPEPEPIPVPTPVEAPLGPLPSRGRPGDPGSSAA